jgi:subtilisin family serine protease
MARLSPLLREKLKTDPPGVPVSCVVEVRPERLDHVLAELEAMGLRPQRGMVSQPVPGGSFFVPVAIPAELVAEVSGMEGVAAVHKSLPRAGGGLTAAPLPAFHTVPDELLGELRIPEVEVPARAALEVLPGPASLLRALGSLAHPLAGLNPVSDVRIIPTGVTVQIIRDRPTAEGAGVTVAVLDTGSPALTPQFAAKLGSLEEFTVVPEPPQDGMGHGSWCHNAACGGEFPSRYGTVEGVAPAVARSVHVKCLNTFPGTGTSEGILKAIEMAVARGAQVISMSLGGPAQGDPVAGDVECRVVNELSERGVIFAVAAGNSGPDPWTAGSPGAALKCVSCASASVTDGFRPAWWSSRGPGSDWDGQHRGEFEALLARYGDELLKPDVSCLGGGRDREDASPDEVVWSGATGWFTPYYDGIPGAECGMHGTSQSTPHVAGLLACLLSDGVISGADDAKRALRETAEGNVFPDPLNEADREWIGRYGKSAAVGWGLIRLSRFK